MPDSALQIRCIAVMRSPVQVARVDETVLAAARRMREHDILLAPCVVAGVVPWWISR